MLGFLLTLQGRRTLLGKGTQGCHRQPACAFRFTVRAPASPATRGLGGADRRGAAQPCPAPEASAAAVASEGSCCRVRAGKHLGHLPAACLSRASESDRDLPVGTVTKTGGEPGPLTPQAVSLTHHPPSCYAPLPVTRACVGGSRERDLDASASSGFASPRPSGSVSPSSVVPPPPFLKPPHAQTRGRV